MNEETRKLLREVRRALDEARLSPELSDRITQALIEGGEPYVLDMGVNGLGPVRVRIVDFATPEHAPPRRQRAKREPPVRVFKVDDGAIYWITAPSISVALEVWKRAVIDSGADMVDVDEVLVGAITEEHARRVDIQLDEGTVSAWHLALASKDKPEGDLLGCSEW